MFIWLGMRVGQRHGGGAFPYLQTLDVSGMRASHAAEMDEVITFALGHAAFRFVKGPAKTPYPRVTPDSPLAPFQRIWPPPRRKLRWPFPFGLTFAQLDKIAGGLPLP